MADGKTSLQASSIKDNYRRSTVGDFLKEKIKPEASLSVVSAYFTMYAYVALQKQLDGIAGLRFLFGDPRSVKAVNPDRQPGQAVGITDEGPRLRDQLQQKRLARECADWLDANEGHKGRVGEDSPCRTPSTNCSKVNLNP